jgi:hypothetical protein
VLLSHFELLHFSLEVFPLSLHLFIMGVKRGIKRSRVYASGSSSSSSDASTPQPSPTRTSPPPASSLEVSSQESPLPIYEHSEPSEGFSVVDLSLGEEDALLDTSWDEEIARKIFNDPNYRLLGATQKWQCDRPQ